MPLNTNLPLSLIVNVQTNVAVAAATAPALNQGLIIGPSTVIPVSGPNSRVRSYVSTTAVLADGFTTTSPEYIAAQLYFGQALSPQVLWIGRHDTTTVATETIVTANEGTGYAVGDLVTIVQTGGSGATYSVTTIGTGGAVTGVALSTPGTGYSVANALSTTTNHAGTGFEINITGTGEFLVNAVTACRAASSAWYGFMATDAVIADHLLLAKFAESTLPYCFYFYSTGDAASASGLSTSVFAQLNALNYRRDMGIYSETQAGLFPNNVYAAAAVMGAMLGANTGLAGSYFNPKFVPISGVAPEPFGQVYQLNNIINASADVIVDYGPYQILGGGGVLPNDTFFDLTLYSDSIAQDIEYAVMNVFMSRQTSLNSQGQQLIINAIVTVCERYRGIGFIAPGVWNGATILSLSTGDSLPKGYRVQSDTYGDETPANRSVRIGMPVYVSLVGAGNINSITIGINVQQ